MTAQLPGQSASPPPTLTPRLAAMSLATRDGEVVHDPDVNNQPEHLGDDPSGLHGVPPALMFEFGPRSDEGGLDENDSRSPSPALTVSNGPTSPPSVADSLVPMGGTLTSLSNQGTSSSSSLPSTSGISAGGPTAPAPQAEVGFGSLHAEEELKKALSGKDRMLVLMLGKEFEAFIGRVLRGEHTTRVTLPASSAGIDLGPSKRIDVAASSKYHRMLVYKLAEWYGLRAVLGVDGSMVVGVLGSLDETSSTLRISTVVPEAMAPQMQRFKIMRREAPSSAGDEDGASRATSVSGEDAGPESAGTRGKTLEERTLAYALARKRIIGDEHIRDDDTTSSAGQPRSRQNSRFGDEEEELDPVPRRAFPEYEYVYPSLYHPQDSQSPTVAAPPSVPQPPMGSAQYGYGAMPPYQGYMGQGMGYPNQQQYQMPQFQNSAQYPGQMPMGGYGQPWPQQMGPAPGMMGGQMPMMHMGGQGWYPPDMSMAPSQPNMMPIIPQGMPYAPNFAYQQQPPLLAQPTPMRPGIDPLSSTASSISSRSYQDAHSRPHSRGSTTSTRSAASSVRLGAMYPAGGQPGYGFRQKVPKAPQGSFSSLKSASLDSSKRNGRQSPASTTSSRSSRRASSIQIIQPQPGQHPLPQRPDWAANNVPYHPSAIMPTGAEPSTSDFPPLHRGPATNAEPMQVEKVKMRPSNGNVWNGAAARNFQQNQHHQNLPHQQHQQHQQHHQQHQNQQHQQHQQHLHQQPMQHGYLNHPYAPTVSDVSPEVPAVSILPNPHKLRPPPQALPHIVADMDPDFPRRMPSSRAPALYDPSAPRQATRHSPVAPVSGTTSAAGTPATALSPTDSVSADDAVEARIAALSAKTASIGAQGRQTSYAKIVRRD